MSLPRTTLLLLLLAGCMEFTDLGPDEYHDCDLVGSDAGFLPASGATLEELLMPWVGLHLTTPAPGVGDVIVTGFGAQRSSRNEYFDAACDYDSAFTVQVDAHLEPAETHSFGSFELVTYRGPGETDEADDRVTLHFTLEPSTDLDAWLPTQHAGFTGPSARTRAIFFLEPGEPAVLRLEVLDAVGESWIVMSDAAVLQP